MNKDSYNRLPKDIQKIIDDMGGEWGVKFAAERMNQAESKTIDEMRNKGVEVISVSPQESARWNKAIEAVAGEEVAALEAKRIPARKVYMELLKFAQGYKR